MQPTKTITILGATGTIGQATLDIISQAPEGYWKIKALTAYHQAGKLAELAKIYKPSMVALENPEKLDELRQKLAGYPIDIISGAGACEKAASCKVTHIVAAISGSAALRSVITAIDHCDIIALANKEAIVMAGNLIKKKIQKNKTTLLPLDSEHNAIFQIFDAKQRQAIDHITLTASGGPFLNTSREKMHNITPEDTRKHPNFIMGEKICIDSATMMNKALEIIEAAFLFDMPADKIHILIHPQQIIHGMITYCDGSTLAQMGDTDMRIPIAYCLFWPERHKTSIKKINLANIAKLDFLEAPRQKFSALAMAYQALGIGGSAPLLLNSANDITVKAFLSKKITFLDIMPTIRTIFDRLVKIETPEPENIDHIEYIEKNAHIIAKQFIEERISA